MQHLIFEGAELTGKSWLMSRIYDHLEPKYNRNKNILDGCHWFNCDVGIYGTEYGAKIIGHYLEIFSELKNKNLLIEKFHLTDIVNNRLHRNTEVYYNKVEEKLEELDFKIILVTFPEDKRIISRRIEDRLNLYPHYERILQDPEWYIKQQQEFLKEVKLSKLPVFIIETNILPDNSLPDKILKWIKEK